MDPTQPSGTKRYSPGGGTTYRERVVRCQRALQYLRRGGAKSPQ